MNKREIYSTEFGGENEGLSRIEAGQSLESVIDEFSISKSASYHIKKSQSWF